jgi:thiamine-phosphate pyrophosphorylase
MSAKKFGKLCVITDTVIQNKYSHEEIAYLASKGGADIIQFREKHLSTSELIKIGKSIRKICDRFGSLYIVNDRVDIAMLTKADGVHLGKEDIPVNEARSLLGKNKIIGGTAHTLREAIIAQNKGADYIGYGHIFETKTKKKSTKPKGIKGLKMILAKIKTPVFAIGGIDLNNVTSVMQCGVFGVAIVGAIVKSDDITKTVKLFKKIIEEKY